MNYEFLIKSTPAFVGRINDRLEGLSLSGASKPLASVGLAHMSLEYYESVTILLARGAYRSSGALIRSQYEALVRSFYYFHCAAEEKAEAFIGGAEPPKISTMISEIERVPGLGSGALSEFHARNWKTMNDLVHGGREQYQRSFSGNELFTNFSEEDKRNLLMSSSILGVLAASQVATIAGLATLALDFQSDFRELFIGVP